MAHAEVTGQLLRACKNGDLETVKQSFRPGGGAPADYQQLVGQAAQEGQLHVVKYLIEESGWHVDAPAGENYALRLAADSGHVAVVKYLIEDSWRFTGQAVDVAEVDNYAIHSAAINKHLEVVRYLIEDSEQLEKMLRADTMWLYELGLSELGRIAVVGFGVEPAQFRTPEDVLLAIDRLELMPNTLTVFLKQLKMPIEQRQPYYLSVACRRAVEAGLVTTLPQLDALLDETDKQLVKKPIRVRF